MKSGRPEATRVGTPGASGEGCALPTASAPTSTGIEGRITRWQDIEFTPPCLYKLHSRIAPVGVLPNDDGTDPDVFVVFETGMAKRSKASDWNVQTRLVWVRRDGGEVLTGAFVNRIGTDGSTAQVSYRTGDANHEVECTWVLGNVAPWVVKALLSQNPGPRPEGSQVKVNMLLDRLPRLRAGVSPPTAFACPRRMRTISPGRMAATTPASMRMVLPELPASSGRARNVGRRSSSGSATAARIPVDQRRPRL